MNKSDSIEFEVIECSSPSSDTIVKMWVFLEGSVNPLKVRSDITKTVDLDDFKYILLSEFKELENSSAKNIEFLNYDKTPILPDADLQTLAKSKTAKDPLFVRYHLSDLIIKVNFKFTVNKRTSKAICAVKYIRLCKKNFTVKLKNIPAINIYFEYSKDRATNVIENDYQIIDLVKDIMKNSEKIVIDLKIQIKDLKSFSEWNIEEVLLDIYNRETDNPNLELGKFDIKNFGQESYLQLSDEELNDMVKELTNRKLAFKTINNNEATAREFISVILIHAVKFIIKHLDREILLQAKVNLTGTHGYGLLDYAILLKSSYYILITEAKSNQTIQKGIAQNLAQIHSASELLGKQKIDQMADLEVIPMFGIVTNGMIWVFIRQTGPIFPIKSAVIEKSDEFICAFEGEMKTEQKMVTYVVRLIQAQLVVLKGSNQQNSKCFKD